MPVWHVMCILTWLLGTGTLFAAIFTKEQTIRVREFIQTVMRCTKIPGLSLAVVKGEETWTEGYGVSDMSSGRAVTSSTLFGVGSITKAFTVSLLSIFLNESSSLSWETPVAAILGRPDFRLGDDYMSNHVTLTDLLTHRTGLTASSWLLFAGFPDSMSLDLFEKRLRYLPISRPFRDSYMYNNWMYCLVGHVVELLGGASGEELLRTRLLQPIGMKHTFTFSAASSLQPEDELATAYMKDEESPVPINTSVYVDSHPFLLAGGMITSADDMSLWMHVLLRRGVTRDGTRVLRESSLKEMQTARVLVPVDMGTFLYEPRFPVTYTDNGYGFAWFTAQYRGYPIVHHPGYFPGYNSFLALLHDLDLGIFIASNVSGHKAALQALFYFIIDLMLGLRPWLSPKAACRFPEPWINTTKSNKSASRPISESQILGESGWKNIEAYLGTFGNMLVGDVVISEDRGGRLSMRLNQLQGRLYRTANDDILLAKPVGSRHFLSLGLNETLFLKLRFCDANGADGRYEELLLGFPASDPEMWSFQRSARFDVDSRYH